MAIKLLKRITSLAFNHSENQTSPINNTDLNFTSNHEIYSNASQNSTQGNSSMMRNSSHISMNFTRNQAVGLIADRFHLQISPIRVHLPNEEAKENSELDANIAAWPKSDNVWQGPLKVIKRNLITCIDDSSDGELVTNYRPASYCIDNPTYCKLYCQGHFADTDLEPTAMAESQFLSQKVVPAWSLAFAD
eukprot:763996-Hanusia_phi.AAC.13